MRFKITFFIIISLIISLYIIPSALSQETIEPSEVQPAEPEKPQPPETKPQEIKQPRIESQQPEAVEAKPVESEKKAIPQEMPKPYAAQGTVSFFFDDADMFEVAQTIFGEVLRVNYVIDPRVKGRVNFRTVAPIPKEEVLSVMEVILRLNGVGFVEEKGLYRIIPLEEVPKELVYSQVGKEPEKVAIELFTFKNLNLKDSMTDIENALGLHLQGGTARILPIYRLNALIVVASSKEQLEYIRKWIEVFDNMFSAARPKIYVYPLQNSKSDHIASILQSIFSGGTTPVSLPKTEPAKTALNPFTTTTAPVPKTAAAAVAAGTGFLVSPETKVFADEISNSLIILATPSDYEFIEETIKKIDIMPRQVVIEGLIARVDLTDNLSFGIRWAIKDVNLKTWGINGGTIDINPGLGVNEKGEIVAPSKGFTYIGTSGDELRAMITALAEKSKAKVLAAPHILVSDNREARIQVGSQVPIATSTTTTLTTTTTTTEGTSVPVTSTIQYKDIGIILKVKPQVNDSGLVSLDITQEISSLGETIKVGGQDEISINKTEANTNLVAQDGETIVIGGLIQENISKSKDGIPFLIEIPIIGNLFGNTTDKTTRTELIILLTPHVIRNIKEAGNVTTDYVDKYRGTTKDKDINKFIKEKSQMGQGGGDAGNKDPKQKVP